MIRKSVLLKVGFNDENLKSATDHDLAIRLAEVTKLAFINKNLYYYLRHPESESVKYAIKMWESGFKILDKSRNRYGYGINVVRKRMAVLHYRIGQCLLRDKRYVKGFSRFLLAGLLDPIRAIKVLLHQERI